MKHALLKLLEAVTFLSLVGLGTYVLVTFGAMMQDEHEAMIETDSRILYSAWLNHTGSAISYQEWKVLSDNNLLK